MSNLVSKINKLAINENINNIRFTDKFDCSFIGHECDRFLWLKLRNADNEKQEINKINKIEANNDIYRRLIKLYYNLSDTVLRTIDRETGGELSIDAINDILKCRVDGIIKNDAIDKNSYAIWQSIAVSEKRFEELKKLTESNSFTVLQEFNIELYAYAMASTYLFGFNKHYLVASSYGGIELIDLITDLNEDAAIYYLQRLYDIINKDDMPDKISNNVFNRPCFDCELNKFCHKKQVANVNCRTCGFCEIIPIEGDTVLCTFHSKPLTATQQSMGCDSHLFITSLMENIAVMNGYDAKNHKIKYKSDTIEFCNGNKVITQDNDVLSSNELKIISDYADKNNTGINDVIYYTVKDNSIISGLREILNAEIKGIK